MALPPLLKEPRGISVTTAAPLAMAAGLFPASNAPALYRNVGKRLVDLLLVVPLLIVIAPVIALVALTVLLTSGWPVFYDARRVGRHGQPFRMWKFRTMIKDADAVLQQWAQANPDLADTYAADFKLHDDPRITRLGNFLRKSSIDELPQLWNVLRGEMSLVGPRPVTEAELLRYGKNTNKLIALRPGMTGRWQLDARNTVSYPERMRMELDYCRAPTLLGDLLVLIRTLSVPFRSSGV